MNTSQQKIISSHEASLIVQQLEYRVGNSIKALLANLPDRHHLFALMDGQYSDAPPLSHRHLTQKIQRVYLDVDGSTRISQLSGIQSDLELETAMNLFERIDLLRELEKKTNRL